MAPRKSVSTAAPGEGPSAPLSPTSTKIPGDASLLTDSGIPAPAGKEKASRQSTGKDQDGMGIDDLLLPRTLTSRLARGILPPNTSIQKDALLALTKSATVFISYLASTANEQSTKKTIGANDVLSALKEMELGQIMELDGREGGGRLERELEAWETVVKGKRKGYREKVKGRQSGAGAEEEDGEPETKRARVEENDGEGDTSMLNGESSHVNGNAETQDHHSKTIFSDDDEEEPMEDTYQEEDADATEDDGNADEDEDEPDEVRQEDDVLENYGPEEQLRRDILRKRDDASGTEDESD